MDITQRILIDHQQQRDLFSTLEQIEPQDITSLQEIWNRLSTMLEVHARAEEELFYPWLLQKGKGADGIPDAEHETLDAIHDHNEIRDAIAATSKHVVGSDAWFDAVAQANKANSDHMGEEERQGLTDFRKHADLETRHQLGIRFVVFEARFVNGVHARDIDPEQYVASHT